MPHIEITDCRFVPQAERAVMDYTYDGYKFSVSTEIIELQNLAQHKQRLIEKAEKRHG